MHSVRAVKPISSRFSITGFVVNALCAALTLLLLDAISNSFRFTSTQSLIVALVIVGLTNALIAPAISVITVPLSALTLGIGAVIVDGALLVLALRLTPGVEFTGDAQLFAIALAHATISVVIASVLSIEDPERVDRRFYRKLSERDTSRITGTVYVQIDGLGYNVLRRAVRDGNAPTIASLIRSRSHRLYEWETDWSSQTGASQRAILMGSNDDMPAFRWYEKTTRRTVVSNRPESARYLEAFCERSHGLLADDGLSVANIYTGGAKQSIFTVSVMAKRKKRIGQGYGPYFSRPYNATRTGVRFAAEIVREIRGARLAKRRNVQPAIHRAFSYAFARAATTVAMQDVSTDVVLGGMAIGTKNIYVDYLGYDEVAHHVGPERADALEALRRVDEHLARIVAFAARDAANYQVAVLSDHGQSQGQTFLGTYGESLRAFVERAVDQSVAELIDADYESDVDNDPGNDGNVIVMASGSLGLIYFRNIDHRATREEINAVAPALIDRLVNHPGVGFVLVKTHHGASAIGEAGEIDITTGAVIGENPIAEFGPRALDKIRRTSSFSNTADIMVNARWDPVDESIGAFEELVGSHGGMGGEQMHAFVLLPSSAAVPEVPIFGAETVHVVLKRLQSIGDLSTRAPSNRNATASKRIDHSPTTGHVQQFQTTDGHGKRRIDY